MSSKRLAYFWRSVLSACYLDFFGFLNSSSVEKRANRSSELLTSPSSLSPKSEPTVDSTSDVVSAGRISWARGLLNFGLLVSESLTFMLIGMEIAVFFAILSSISLGSLIWLHFDVKSINVNCSPFHPALSSRCIIASKVIRKSH